MCSLPSGTIFSVEASKPSKDISPLTEIAFRLLAEEITDCNFDHLSCVGLTRALDKSY